MPIYKRWRSAQISLPTFGKCWVSVGDLVKVAQKAAVLEAMKMKIDLTVPELGAVVGQGFKVKAELKSPDISVSLGDVVVVVVE